jgi:hypothetical protein
VKSEKETTSTGNLEPGGEKRMKFYAEVSCRRVIEIETEDYESAVLAADQQVTALLPEREQWKPEIEVSAVRGQGENRYYVRRVTAPGQPPLFQVRERQLQYQAGPDNPGIHPSDPLIRPFGSDQESAQYYARSMSDLQHELDKRYGRWVRHAVTPQDTGSEGVTA